VPGHTHFTIRPTTSTKRHRHFDTVPYIEALNNIGIVFKDLLAELLIALLILLPVVVALVETCIDLQDTGSDTSEWAD
jgi:hypothetical protein